MRYKKQSHNACFAYALWQIGVVEEKAVREYEQEQCFDGWEKLDNWLGKYLPALENNLKRSSLLMLPTGDKGLSGRGIIYLCDKVKKVAHAISYEDGIVLDSSQPEERMSLEEYLKRYLQWEVVEIFPIEKEKKL